MTGAIAALVGDNAASTIAGGAPAAPQWTGIYGDDSASCNPQTLSGFTGALGLTATITGGATLYYSLNGPTHLYTGLFNVSPGDVLYWTVAVGRFNRSGTITVTNSNAATTLATIPYAVTTTFGGGGYQ